MSHKPTAFPSRVKLHDLTAIRHEMGVIYRLARSGKLEWSDATKAVHCLSQIAKLQAATDVEARLLDLEQLYRQRGALEPNRQAGGRYSPFTQ